MGTELKIKEIGKVHFKNGQCFIQLKEAYRDGLKNIEGFSHLQIVWWGNQSKLDEAGKFHVVMKPYKNGPEKLGVFATRSEQRPNPILITNIFVQKIDYENGLIYTPYIDAFDATPVLDIKPYHQSDRIKDCRVPDWSKHWPEWYEDAADFDWESEFNF